MKRVLILGCTGSIGKSSIDIVQNMPEEFIVCGLQAHSNKEELSKLSKKFNCPTLLSSENNSEEAFNKLINDSKPDIVINGIAGAAGLLPSKVV